MKEVLDLYRAGHIATSTPLKIFDLSKTEDAFRYFRSQERIGKVAISTENAETSLRVSKVIFGICNQH